MKILIKTISTVFYVGYLPLIPGTFGSAAGLFFYYLVKDNIINYILLTCILIILGLMTAGKAERIFNKKDARFIVIDEASGMLVSLLFIPYEIKYAIAAFFLFRLLDTLKPFPAGRLEQQHGSIGIMGDDLVSALYANIILQVVLRLASFKA